MTLTVEEALQRAQAVLDEGPTSTPVALIDDMLESSNHWVFFFNSVAFIESGDFGHALAGNAPIVVPKGGGAVTRFFTGRSPEEQLAELEASHRSDR